MSQCHLSATNLNMDHSVFENRNLRKNFCRNLLINSVLISYSISNKVFKNFYIAKLMEVSLTM